VAIYVGLQQSGCKSLSLFHGQVGFVVNDAPTTGFASPGFDDSAWTDSANPNLTSFTGATNFSAFFSLNQHLPECSTNDLGHPIGTGGALDFLETIVVSEQAAWPSVNPVDVHEAAAFRYHFTAPDLPYRLTEFWYWAPEPVVNTTGGPGFALNGNALQTGNGGLGLDDFTTLIADSYVNRAADNVFAWTCGPIGWDVRADPPGGWPWGYNSVEIPCAWITWVLKFDMVLPCQPAATISGRSWAAVIG
jgi:hypothetical protein